MINEYQGDELQLCPRCQDGDARVRDGICYACQGELLSHYDGTIGWRETWQWEQDEKRRAQLAANPNYVADVLAALNEYATKFADDPNC